MEMRIAEEYFGRNVWRLSGTEGSIRNKVVEITTVNNRDRHKKQRRVNERWIMRFLVSSLNFKYSLKP